MVHWVLVESERDPANDPLVIWYQGGPGASSLFGFFVEFGPFMLNDESLSGAAYNSTGVPQLVRNPYSWSKVRTERRRPLTPESTVALSAALAVSL